MVSISRGVLFKNTLVNYGTKSTFELSELFCGSHCYLHKNVRPRFSLTTHVKSPKLLQQWFRLPLCKLKIGVLIIKYEGISRFVWFNSGYAVCNSLEVWPYSVSTASLLMQSNFNGPLVTVSTGLHCISHFLAVLKMLLKTMNNIVSRQ